MARAKGKLRAIVYSDLHKAHYNKFNEGNRRLLNAQDVMKRVKVMARVHKCPIIFLGDLFHKEKHITNPLLADTLPFLGKMFKSNKIMTYAITGNHDQSQSNTIDNPSPSYIKTLANTFKGIECLDFKSKDLGDWELFGVPYLTHDLGLVDYINSIDINPGKVNVLMLHTTMPNVQDTDGRTMVSHIPVNDFEKAVGRFDIVLSGHIHKPMQFGIGKTTVVQVGAPQQQRLTDKNCEMGCWLIHQNFDVEFMPFNNYPRFIEIPPNKPKPDNKHFYVVTQEKKEQSKTTVSKTKFGNTLSGNKLARNYCKEKGIKDKVKRKALKETLKNAQHD